MTKTKKILHLVLDDIAGFFPYFFVFYIFSLLVALFSHPWESFFNWELFTLCVVALGIASLFGNKERLFSLFGLWKRLGRSGQIKIILILAVLIFALTRGIGFIDFIVFAYASISIFFVLESKISAGLAIALLAACPFFLLFKKDAIAEILAVYAYYFLVITVMTQIASLVYPQEASTDLVS